MQNERLFKKIKDVALTKTTGTEEYNPEKLWADIENKKSKTDSRLWWPSAAASVLLFIGLSFWFSTPKLASYKVTKKVGRIKNNTLSKNKATYKSHQLIIRYPVVASENIWPKKSIETKEKEVYILKPTSELANSDIVSTDDLSGLNKFLEVIDTSKVEKINLKVSDYQTENVLVADISLPEEKTEGYPVLRQIFARKDIKARKSHLHFQREIKKSGFRSFVHNSLVQYPPAVHPNSAHEKVDTTH
ncbi:hypothetical protein [Dyadobacter sp. CY356]|uniref:hypothetical protein n=1 Tax=Dyadobacter sp. CY356 TaxID=2906442 RepID=UPI001F338BDB|nr:hypothetical protein [Dyadobacter sp. CY356]MCF0054828.1 hypothetical protein [Dyadobacter sp. CY356]